MSAMHEDDAEAMRKVRNRLARARGQLDAVIAAVESGGDCRDVVTQLAAVSKAIDRAGFTIVSTALQRCIVEGDDGDRPAEDAGARRPVTVEELERLFLSLA